MKTEAYERYFVVSANDASLTQAERDKVFAMGGEDERGEIEALLDECAAAACPKAICGSVPIEEKGEDYVVIEGVKIACPLMRKNFDGCGRVFPFVATCGTELEKIAESKAGDFLAEYWVDEIMKMYLHKAISAMNDFVREKYAVTGGIARMNPGSLKEWPLSGQRQLFSILGNVQAAVGVRLTESLLMLPSKSVSGIMFETEVKYENCQHCPILKCPNRRAGYIGEPEL